MWVPPSAIGLRCKQPSCGENAQLLLARYAIERLLYHLSRSTHRDRFALKGAMLFSL